MTQQPSQPPAGWFPDPQASGQLRYFDGQSWTDWTSPTPDAGQTEGQQAPDATGSLAGAVARWSPRTQKRIALTVIFGSIGLLGVVLLLMATGHGDFFASKSAAGSGQQVQLRVPDGLSCSPAVTTGNQWCFITVEATNRGTAPEDVAGDVQVVLADGLVFRAESIPPCPSDACESWVSGTINPGQTKAFVSGFELPSGSRVTKLIVGFAGQESRAHEVSVDLAVPSQ